MKLKERIKLAFRLIKSSEAYDEICRKSCESVAMDYWKFRRGINHLLEKVIQDSARRDDVGITSKFSSFTIHEPIFNLEKDMLGDLLFMSEAAPNFKNEKDAPKKYIVDYLMVKLGEDERFMEKATDTQTVALKLASFLIKNNYIKTRIDQLDSGQIKVVYWVNTFKEDEH